MPDTGAPWNIPYVASTDLVSDWPADSLALANAIDAGLDAADNAGIGSNVVSVTKTDTFTTSASSYTSVTGLSASITPTSASSKVLVLYRVMASAEDGQANERSFVTVFRGATNLVDAASPSNRTPALTSVEMKGITGGTRIAFTYGGVFLDSPATTSSTTYEVQVFTDGNGIHINRSRNDTDDAEHIRGTSEIVLIEVAA